MPQRYDKYKIKAILLFSIIICLFATRFIYYSTLLNQWKIKQMSIIFLKSTILNFIIMHFTRINNMEASKDIVSDAF